MRLIDADALIEKSLKDANCYMDNNDIRHGYHNVQCLIYDAPTIDAVPVVRCKDCKHGTDRTNDFQEEDERGDVVNPIACMMYSSDGIPDFFPKDNYCGFGERKGELNDNAE